MFMDDSRWWSAFSEVYGRITDEIRLRNRCHSETALGQLDGLEMALTELRDSFRHTHVRSDDADICALCGLDLRNEIHRTASRPSPAEQERSA